MSNIQQTSPMPPPASVRQKLYNRDYASALRVFRTRWFEPLTGTAQTQTGSGVSPSDRQSWRQWAGDRLRRRSSAQTTTVEHVHLFPGWAARRYNDSNGFPTPLDRLGAPSQGARELQGSLDVFVSGYATSITDISVRSRSERTIMRLAKAFANLPKLSDSDSSSAPSSTSPSRRPSDELLHGKVLPPRPDQIDEMDTTLLQRLEEHLQQHATAQSSSSESDSERETPVPSRPQSPPSFSNPQVKTQHDNLVDRLRPFWSRNLPNRRIQLSVYVCSTELQDASAEERKKEALLRDPIHVSEVTTGPQGDFSVTLKVTTSEISRHAYAKGLLSDNWNVEQELYIHAELYNKPVSPTASASSLNEKDSPPSTPSTPIVVAKAGISVHVSHSDVRLISDIDDTVKYSNILGGARIAFRNVFARPLDDLVIKGMGEWYSAMWEKGVRFHYVSNSPFQLLPVINDFFEISRLPRGSIKLKSYSGFSLSNIFSAPANRKRDAVCELLSTFSDSRFLLVGDTGEQDLELYAECARMFPEQILAVFLRDASGDDVPPLDDPTGEKVFFMHADSNGAYPNRRSTSIPFGLSAFRSSSTTPMPDAPAPARRRLSPTQSLPIPNSLPSSPSSPAIATPIAREHDESCAVTPTQSTTAHPLNPPEPSSPSMCHQSRRGQSGPRMPSLEHLRSISSPPYSLPTWSRIRRPTPIAESPDVSASDPPRQNPILGEQFTEAPEESMPTMPDPLHVESLPGAFSGRVNGRSSTSSTTSSASSLPPSERKRLELQHRVWRARQITPKEIPLRVFRDPLECVEAFQVLDKVQTEKVTKQSQGRTLEDEATRKGALNA